MEGGIKGLRKDFERPAKQLLPVLLKRIDDKSVWKPHVLIERVEQLLWSASFDLLLEELRGVRVGDGRALAEVAQHRRRRDGPGGGVRRQLRLRLHPEREVSARALAILSTA